MILKKQTEYTGYSEASLDEAFQHAQQHVGSLHPEVVETKGSIFFADDRRHYQVTLIYPSSTLI